MIVRIRAMLLVMVALLGRVQAADKPPRYTPDQIRELCYKLSSNDDKVRWDTAEELIKAGPQATDMLCQVLQGEWLEGRKLAAYLLGEIKDARAVLPLASCLGDPEFHVRWKCAVSLKNIGKPSVDALVQVLRTGNLRARHCAAWALGEIKDPRATLALAEAATADDTDLRWKAVISLKRIGPPALVELRRLLRQGNVQGRRCSVWAIDQLGGPEAEKAGVVESLLDALKDSDAEVRQRAAAALARYDRPDVRTALEKMIEDENANVRRQAVRSMATLGKPETDAADAAAAIPRVRRWQAFDIEYRPEGAPAPDGAMEVTLLTPSHGSRTIAGFRTDDGWAARVAPDEPGEWFYKLTFTAGGRETVEHGMFTCEASELVGPLRLEPAPRPHLVADGKPLTLIEAPMPPRPPAAIEVWKPFLEACGKHGFNLVRLDLQLMHQAMGDAAAGLIDQILTIGYNNGVYFLLTLFDEDHLRDAAFWAESPYNAENGGPIDSALRLPMFYDPVSPGITAMQEGYIRQTILRAGAHANVIFELCRNFNTGAGAVPFARSWVQQRLKLFERCGRLVMLSAADDAARLCAFDGISIAGVAPGVESPPGKLPAVLMPCPPDAAGAIAAGWRAAVGIGGFASWKSTPVTAVTDAIRFVAQAEKRAWVLRAFAANDTFYNFTPDNAVVLGSAPGISAVAQTAGRRALVFIGDSANGGEKVTLGMPAGKYRIKWFDTRIGEYRKPDSGEQNEGIITLECPRFTGGIVAEVAVE